jgi:energy-coupling factor transporter ATP-binding protein EcfA2
MVYCISLQEVIGAIHAVRNVRNVRIVIDGKDGSGKSTLAKQLSAVLELPCISLDSFLEKDKGGYVEYIDYIKLKEALEKFEGYIVEGVCLHQVLRRIEVAPAVNIYVRRVKHGVWLDEDTLDVSNSVEAVLVRERGYASLFSSDSVISLGLTEEVIRYHAEFRPHESADVTYSIFIRKQM